MHYVYILESISTPGRFYIGYTTALPSGFVSTKPTSLATPLNIALGN